MVVTDAHHGVVISHVEEVTMSGLNIQSDGPAVQIEQAKDVNINGMPYAEVGERQVVSL